MQVYAEIRYERIRQIGAGQGMNSEVFVARCLHLDREIAVKEIDVRRINPGGWDAYHQEARAIHASSHRNVVPILYACRTANLVCLAMPYFNNGSLHDRIDTAPLSLQDGYRVADGVLAALTQVHTSGFLHFDVKPSNILFSATHEPMIADFGQSRLIDPATGIAAAPALYMYGAPPEALVGGVGTAESDVYQAGLTLYRMFNGNSMFDAQKPSAAQLLAEITSGRFPNRRRFMPHVPRGLCRVIRKALKVDPPDRYHSATEFRDALARVPIPLDWRTHIAPTGETTWQASRNGRADLEVRLLTSATPGRWDVEVHTVNRGSRRRKGANTFWESGLTRLQAADHLFTVVFSQLN